MNVLKFTSKGVNAIMADILSQSQIDALIRGINSGEVNLDQDNDATTNEEN